LNDDVHNDNNDNDNKELSYRGTLTESFYPASTLVRPDVVILVGLQAERCWRLSNRGDVVIVPHFFCDWNVYCKLFQDM
jgi:hypothetical protein